MILLGDTTGSPGARVRRGGPGIWDRKLGFSDILTQLGTREFSST